VTESSPVPPTLQTSKPPKLQTYHPVYGLPPHALHLGRNSRTPVESKPLAEPELRYYRLPGHRRPSTSGALLNTGTAAPAHGHGLCLGASTFNPDPVQSKQCLRKYLPALSSSYIAGNWQPLLHYLLPPLSDSYSYLGDWQDALYNKTRTRPPSFLLHQRTQEMTLHIYSLFLPRLAGLILVPSYHEYRIFAFPTTSPIHPRSSIPRPHHHYHSDR